jgi:hypothetical protein
MSVEDLTDSTPTIETVFCIQLKAGLAFHPSSSPSSPAEAKMTSSMPCQQLGTGLWSATDRQTMSDHSSNSVSYLLRLGTRDPSLGLRSSRSWLAKPLGCSSMLKLWLGSWYEENRDSNYTKFVRAICGTVTWQNFTHECWPYLSQILPRRSSKCSIP